MRKRWRESGCKVAMWGKMWYICNVIVLLGAQLTGHYWGRDWKTMRPSAAASETKKATRYYAKTTKQVSKNLKKGSVKVSFGLGSMYSAAKSVFKRLFG